MALRLSTSKGTLIQMFVTFDDGTGLNINPLHYDAAIIAFGSEANQHIKGANVPDGHVVVYNHEREVVADFCISGQILEIKNTVLYPNGNVWSGPILQDLESKDVTYIVLTEQGLTQLERPEGATFEASDSEHSPTIIVGMKSLRIPTCSEDLLDHRCTACWFKGKLIVNGLCRV
jgi:hypothetical protein